MLANEHIANYIDYIYSAVPYILLIYTLAESIVSYRVIPVGVPEVLNHSQYGTASGAIVRNAKCILEGHENIVSFCMRHRYDNAINGCASSYTMQPNHITANAIKTN